MLIGKFAKYISRKSLDRQEFRLVHGEWLLLHVPVQLSKIAHNLTSL